MISYRREFLWTLVLTPALFLSPGFQVCRCAAADRDTTKADPKSSGGEEEQCKIIYLYLKEDLVRKFVDQKYESVYEFGEAINDIPSRGKTDSRSRTHFGFVEDENKAVFLLKVRGTNQSQATSYAYDFQIHSQARTEFGRNYRLTLSEQGINVEASKLVSRTTSSLTGVDTPFKRLVGKVVSDVVWKEAARQKPEFDREAKRRELENIESKMNERVLKALFLVKRFEKKSGGAFKSVQEAFDISTRFQTTSDQLMITLATPTKSVTNPPKKDPPEPPAAPLVVQIHSSMFLKALTEAEAINSLRPILDDLVSRDDKSVGQFREAIQKGKVDTKWTDDRNWFTVTWQPPAEIPRLDL